MGCQLGGLREGPGRALGSIDVTEPVHGSRIETLLSMLSGGQEAEAVEDAGWGFAALAEVVQRMADLSQHMEVKMPNMKADARVVPVCPTCGEDLVAMSICTSDEAIEGAVSVARGDVHRVWVCGCSDLKEALKGYAKHVADRFIGDAPALYAGVETMEDLPPEMYGEVRNVVDGVRDFVAWLTDREYWNERLEEREELRRVVEARMRM